MKDYRRGNGEINYDKRKWEEIKMKWRDRKVEKNKGRNIRWNEKREKIWKD